MTGERKINPDKTPIISTTTGMTINPPSCCAARTSLTFEETKTQARTLIKQAVGANNSIDRIQVRFGNSGYPTFGISTISSNATPRLKARNVDPIEGINAEKIFPASISPSVVGVASKGSKLRLFFSPTILYVAMIVGRVAGTIIKIMSIMLNIIGRT